MRPWTAGQKRFSLRVSQIAQLKSRFSSSALWHWMWAASLAIAIGRAGGGLLPANCGRGVRRLYWSLEFPAFLLRQ
jgi:hypothetical protein